MDAPTGLALGTATVFAGGLALSTLPLLTVRIRRAAGPRLGLGSRVPRWAAGFALVSQLTRIAPAQSAMPPPVVWLEHPSDHARDDPGPPAMSRAGSVALAEQGAAPPRLRVSQPPLTPEAYVVKPGDSLWAIAFRLLVAADPERRPGDGEVEHLWRRIYASNRDVIGPDPNLIFPGQTLVLPGEG